ncbi:uncharacterized protein LOC126738462 [Anthonomus grandis grandis]|uniref:uncharacterized protein LOC126738462 n=1 Tax=Anthonomus grandis grandis TaxID=2921223 RepID=UPI002166BD3F|nr:uncharacterized protein LOC126738462 [Anthonomus grandis grandis]
MDPLLWWVILVCLISLITALSFYLLYNLSVDYFKQKNTTKRRKTSKLSKYKFERTDVEDLTSIEKNYQHFNPKITFVSEVEFKPQAPKVGKVRSRKGSLLPDIHENSSCQGSLYSVEDIMSEVNNDRRNSELLPRRFSLVTEGMRKNSLASTSGKFTLKPDYNNESTDTLDCLDPTTIETKRNIANIEDDVQKTEYEITYFMGASRNLKFYEINEKLIRLNMALSELDCCSEELRRRKKEVQGYIGRCKEQLNSKVQ